MPDILKFIANSGSIESDPNGYLLNLDDWDEETAHRLAQSEGLVLTAGHWEVLHFLRDHYRQYGKTPNVRSLMKMLAREQGPEKATRKYLYDLFPQGPSLQGCRIAGLPRPNDCIDMS